jgi:hypothetical protein
LSVKEYDMPRVMREKMGVFVSIYRLAGASSGEGKSLRGCIGFPLPVKPLYKGIVESAVEAAFNDPRFPPLKRDELNKVIIEVTVLTPPKLIDVSNPIEYLRKVKIGRDGLIIERGIYRGLLLPQVPIEYNWDVEEYLMHLCLKAGLPPNAWLEPESKIYRFTGQIFCEKSPRGEVVEEKLSS